MSINERFVRPKGAGSAQDFSVLIAVEPPSFQRLIQHILFGHSGLLVVGSSSKRVSPSRQAARLAPDVIIVSTRLNGKEPGDVLADLKRSCPASTLILLTHGHGDPAPPKEADAWLPEEAVLTRLVPAIRKAAPRVRNRVPRPASASPRT